MLESMKTSSSGYVCILDTSEAVRTVMRLGDKFNFMNYPELFHNLLGDCACNSCRITARIIEGRKKVKL